jgi:hypothetical protein
MGKMWNPEGDSDGVGSVEKGHVFSYWLNKSLNAANSDWFYPTSRKVWSS